MTGLYLDTSALAKRYLNEPFSEQFEAFIREEPTAAISRLSVVEFRCLLARRRRAGEITKAIEPRVYASFEKDVGAGFLQVYPVADEHLIAYPRHSLPTVGHRRQNHGGCGKGRRLRRRAFLLDRRLRH